MTSNEKLRVLCTARCSGDQPWLLRWLTSEPWSSSSRMQHSMLCRTHSCKGVSPEGDGVHKDTLSNSSNRAYSLN